MALVLIIEDRATDRELLVTLLTHGGHESIECDNGADGLRLARERKPDLVIADMLVPEMDGLGFTRALREDPEVSGTPVILYTATYERWELERLARAAGVSLVLEKPTDPEDILRAIEQALRPAAEGS